MNVVFAIKGLYEAAGGAERVICSVTAEMARRGHKVTLVSFDASALPPFYLVDSRVELVGLGVGTPRTRTCLRDFVARTRKLRRFLFQKRPDAVVAFMHSMFIPVAFALVGTGIPVIASEHIVREHYQKRWGQYALYILAVPFIRTITVLSSHIAMRYPWWIRRKMVSVANPLGTEFLNTISTSHENGSLSEETRVILSIGRFDDQKDHITLVRAFALIADEFKDWRLRIVGDGPLRDSIAKEVKELGLSDQIVFPGTIKDIIREFESATFFALASKYESFGLVVAEAMACGKAVLAFADCSGLNELIEHEKTGLLLNGADRVKIMAEGLRYLITNQKIRAVLGDEAQKNIAGRFSLNKISNQWENIICSV